MTLGIESSIGSHYSEYSNEAGGYTSVSNFELAVVLGTLGFEMRRVNPISIVFSANKLSKSIRSNHDEDGLLEDSATFEACFAVETRHALFGSITVPMIDIACKIAMNKIKKAKGEFSLAMDRDNKALLDRFKALKGQTLMLDMVQAIIDGMSNYVILAELCSLLQKDPLVSYMKNASKGGVQHAISILSNGDEVMKQAEKYFKSR